MEMCSGCGAMAESHPIVGVTRDVETDLMTAFPVCLDCWQDPVHRQQPLKMHFFPKEQAPIAVKAAEDNILVQHPEPRGGSE